MSDLAQSQAQPTAPTAVLQIGALRITGRAAQLLGMPILVGLVLLVVWLGAGARWQLWTAGGIWLAFIIYWSMAARKRAARVSSESAGSRKAHNLMMNGGLVLLFLSVPGLRTRFMPLSMALQYWGLALLCAGLALAIWARVHLGRNWSDTIAVVAEQRLVRNGPYRWVRHPIYTAMLTMALGTMMVSGELHALAGVILVTLAYARKIGIEEATLRRTFGAEYDDYRRHSWALVPPLI